MEKSSLFKYAKSRIINQKSISIPALIYALFCLISTIYSFSTGYVRNGLLSILFLSFSALIYILEYLLKIKFVPLFIYIMLFIATGALLGSCYNFYHIIPFLDTLLHGLAGISFACLGYVLMQIFVGVPSNKKSFFACVLFGVAFSLSIAVIWEIFEYAMTNLLGFDMMADTVTNNFNSYLISGTHNEAFEVHDIDKTLIYYGNNQILTINGYLDIGLIDTLEDMIICTIGSLVFLIITTISYFKCKKINELFLPHLNK